MAAGRIVITLVLIAQCAVWTVSGKICVNDCSKRSVGFYQSCTGCHQFTTCIFGKVYPMTCAPGTVWDDYWKSCQRISQTCPDVGTSPYGSTIPAPGIGSSRKSIFSEIMRMISVLIPSIQYTFGYHGAMSTSKQPSQPAIFQHGEPVVHPSSKPANYRPSGLGKYRPSKPGKSEPSEPVYHPSTVPHGRQPSSISAGFRGLRCVTTCIGKEDGPYQLCGSCRSYVICNNGRVYKRRCGGSKVWDDVMHSCLDKSTTCPVDMSSLPMNVLTNADISNMRTRGWWFWRKRRTPRPTSRPKTTTTRAPTTTTTTTTTAPPITFPKYNGPFESPPPGSYFPGLGPLECTDSTEGYEYTGRTSTTVSGRTCQHWESQQPHGHENCKLHGRNNYCTNVDNPSCRKAQPWCYTTDPGMRLELCDIPKCLVCNGKPGSRCVRACPYDGVFQSCRSCFMYVTCSGGIMRDWNTCPVGRVWDDKKKGCELLSTTCRDCL